jgi:hypothetical protein
MNTFLNAILQFFTVVFGWISSGPIPLIITVLILATISILSFLARVLPYKQYPKNRKAILPGEILRLIKSFFVSLLVLVVLYVLVVLGSTIQSYISKVSRLQELQAVYKNISQDYLLADVTTTDIKTNPNGSVLTLKIEYYPYGDRKNSIASEEVSIEGTSVYIDCTQYNFEYSHIETGESKNLALPYRVFSNTISASEGINLNPYSGDGIPYIFERTEKNLWGIEPQIYKERVAELVKIMNDPLKSKQEGILRSSSGSALHFLAQKNKTYRIYVTQIGGLTLAQKSDWL